MMLRRLFALLSAVSLVLFVAVCVLWVRSYRAQDLLMYSDGARDGRLSSGIVDSTLGGLTVAWQVLHVVPGREEEYDREYYVWNPHITRGFAHHSSDVEPFKIPPREALEPLVGFRWHWHSGPQSNSHLVWQSNIGGVLPHWAAVSAFALLPVLWLVRRRRADRRLATRLCTACGYDLRATPDRCPECGAVPVGHT